MATPQSNLNLSGAEPLTPARPAPRAPSRSGLNLSGAEPIKRPSPAPRASLPPVDSRLDSFVNDVIGEASRRTGYKYKLGEGPRTAEQQAGKVAQGVSWTYNSAHMHGRGRDVVAFDERGNYIKDGSHPAYKALGDVYGEYAPKAPARIKWGVVRDGQQVDPGHFELLDGDDDEPAPSLNLEGAEPLNLSGAEPVAEVAADPERQKLVEEYGEPVVTSSYVSHVREPGADAPRAYVTNGPPPALPAPLQRRQTFDPRSEEGRRGRDERARLERTPGAFLEVAVPLPPEERLSDVAAGSEMMRAAYVSAAGARGVPEEFAAKWIDERGGTRLSNTPDGEAVAPADALTDDALDASARTLRVRLNPAHLSKMVEDYRATGTNVGRAVAWATDPERSPGEKALDVAGPPVALAARGVAKGAELAGRAMKPLDMFSARLWTRLGGGTAEQARAASDAVWNDQPLPEYARNFVRDDIERDMSRLNPRVGKAYGLLAEMLTDPTNLIPTAGAVKLADKFADGVRAVRAARRAEEIAAAVADVERVVDEARGLSKAGAQTVADDALGGVARAEDGARHLVGETGAAVDAAAAPKGRAALEAEGYTVARVDAPNRAAGEAAGQKVWRITDPDGRTNIAHTDAELDDFAEMRASGRPASESLNLEGAEPLRPASASQNILTGDASRPGSGMVIDEAGLRRKAAEHNMPLEEVRAEAARQGYIVEGGDDAAPLNLEGAEPLPSAPRSSAEVAESIRVSYARERADFYRAQAESAPDATARSEFETLAREYADEADEARVSDVAQRVREGADVSPEEMANLERAVLAEDGTPAYIEVDASGGAPAPPARRAARSPLRRAWDKGLDAWDASKSLFASADLSAAGRQSLVPFLFDTRATARGLVKGTPAALPGRQADFARWLDSQPSAKMWEEMGLDLDTMTGGHNEFFTSRLAEKIPLYGPGVIQPSDRAMTAQLDAVRLMVAESWAKDLRAAGLTPEANPEEFKAVARLINAASGRAELGRVGQALYPVTRRVIFSPKLLKSRFTMVNPYTYMKLPPAARKVAAKRLGKAAAKLAPVLGLAYLTADRVGLNPFRGDFMHARYGDTTYDLSGGVANKLRFVFQLVQSVGTTAAAASKGELPEYKDTPFGVATRFLRSQLAPGYSIIPDALTGETYDGKPFTWTEGVVRRITPGFAQDVYDGFVEGGGAVGAVKALPSFVGVSARTRNREELQREWASSRDASSKARARERTAGVMKGAPAEVRDELQRLRVYVAESDAGVADRIAEAVARAQAGPGWSKMGDAERKRFLENIVAGVRKEAGAVSSRRAESAGRAKEGERVGLTGAAAEEVARLGVVVDPVFAGHRVGTFNGESAGFRRPKPGTPPEREDWSLGQTPEMLEEYRRELAEETQRELERVMAFDGFGGQSEAVRRSALQQAVDRVKQRVRGSFHFDTRRRQYGERERLLDYQRRLEGRGPGVKPGETLKLGGDAPKVTANRLDLQGQRESVNVEDRRAVDAGAPEVDDAQAADIALFLDGLEDYQAESVMRGLDEYDTMPAARPLVRGAARAVEHVAGGMGAEGQERLLRSFRLLARERELRPNRFRRDARAGRYGAMVRQMVEAAPSFPENRLPWEKEIRRAVEQADPDAEPTFTQFPEGTGGGFNLPRSSMPQVKGEHRGAMVNYLQARGISHKRETVAAGDLKPSQAEYSPEKVKRAQGYDGTPRALLVSSDGYVADGHHQWLSDLAKDPRARVDVIRLDAPILPLLIEMARFPSSGEDRSSAGAERGARLPGEGKPPLTRDELRQMAKAEGLTVAEVAREARAQGYQVAA